MRDYKVIAIDFDGTLWETDWPRLVRPILPVIEMAKTRKAAGDKLILWTCREGAELDAAVEACREWGLEFDAVNDNLPELKEKWGNNPRKVAADVYWDDHATYYKAAFDWFAGRKRKEATYVTDMGDIRTDWRYGGGP